MARHKITIRVDGAFRDEASTEPLHKVALATLVHQKLEAPCDLAVVVTDDETSRALHHRHLGIDRPTDVLAFPNVTRGPFVEAPGQAHYLGDVIISFPRARAQAGELGHEVLAELQLLTVHELLHLLGHDDAVDGKRARMFEAQDQILSALGVDIALPE